MGFPVFTCLQCGKPTPLPTCRHCGHAFETIDGVYQLTRDPNLNLGQDAGPNYIGYDRVGESYYDKDWADTACGPAEMAVGAKVAELIGAGVLLDLGCGGGTFGVPAALHGCTVIGGDISQEMLKILIRKAVANHVPAGRIIPCRMNALAVPLDDASVDGAVANSVLHLISDPGRVVAEIHRVLRPGGRLILQDNSPGASTQQSQELQDANSECTRREGEFHRRYWQLVNERGVHSTHFSWSFDQFIACKSAFAHSTRVTISCQERRTGTMEQFLRRMGGKGFSRQQGVPDDLHEQVFAQVVAEFAASYGPDFAAVPWAAVSEGIELRVFEK